MSEQTTYVNEIPVIDDNTSMPQNGDQKILNMNHQNQVVTIKQEVIPNHVSADGTIIDNDVQMSNGANGSHVSIAANNNNGGYIYALSNNEAPEATVQETVQIQGNQNSIIYTTNHDQSYHHGTVYSNSRNNSTFYTTTDISNNEQQIHINQNMSNHVPGTYVAHRHGIHTGSHPINHSNRTAPITVRWLIENYETADGVSLPRSTLYNHYLHHCQDGDMEPMNPASFGKLIRSVFLGLRTRRLGTRGNSKYHYYGLRIKQDSPLNQFTEENAVNLRNTGLRCSGFAPLSSAQQQQYLGEVSVILPNIDLEDVTEQHYPDGLNEAHLNSFESVYKEHCEAVLDAITNLQFGSVESLWAAFWKPTDNSTVPNSLGLSLMKKLCEMPVVQKFVLQCDFAFYQSLVQVLMPNVLRLIPGTLTASIRNFAKNLESSLKPIIEGYDLILVQNKISAVVAFSQTLRRYTSLNHLAQAARAVVQNHTQINQMLSDLNKLDFASMQEQAVWICQCEDETIFSIENQMKLLLRQHRNLEQWANWLSGIVTAALQPHVNSGNLKKFARKFLLKWSFYSSLVIRDLTLRSAASFGSFHLIRLLFDEYIYYLVEHHVAMITNEHVISLTMANNEDNRVEAVKIQLPPLVSQSVKIESSMIIPNVTNSHVNISQTSINNSNLINTEAVNGVSEQVVTEASNNSVIKNSIKMLQVESINEDATSAVSEKSGAKRNVNGSEISVSEHGDYMSVKLEHIPQDENVDQATDVKKPKVSDAEEVVVPAN